MVVDLSKQEFLNELGLEEHMINYESEIRKLCALLVEKDDPLLVERIKRIEEKRDKCFKLLRILQREISPKTMLTNANIDKEKILEEKITIGIVGINPGYH